MSTKLVHQDPGQEMVYLSTQILFLIPQMLDMTGEIMNFGD